MRWAACQALGQMCTDLGPELQNNEHARLLPGMMAVMDDFSAPRVQAHASAAIVNFSENCEQVGHQLRTAVLSLLSTRWMSLDFRPFPLVAVDASNLCNVTWRTFSHLGHRGRLCRC